MHVSGWDVHNSNARVLVPMLHSCKSLAMKVSVDFVICFSRVSFSPQPGQTHSAAMRLEKDFFFFFKSVNQFIICNVTIVVHLRINFFSNRIPIFQFAGW